MTETTWTHSMNGATRGNAGGAIARLWAEHVLTPLHRVLDAALHADDLRALNGATLYDIGLQRD